MKSQDSAAPYKLEFGSRPAWRVVAGLCFSQRWLLWPAICLCAGAISIHPQRNRQLHSRAVPRDYDCQFHSCWSSDSTWSDECWLELRWWIISFHSSSFLPLLACIFFVLPYLLWCSKFSALVCGENGSHSTASALTCPATVKQVSLNRWAQIWGSCLCAGKQANYVPLQTYSDLLKEVTRLQTEANTLYQEYSFYWNIQTSCDARIQTLKVICFFEVCYFMLCRHKDFSDHPFDLEVW